MTQAFAQAQAERIRATAAVADALERENGMLRASLEQIKAICHDNYYSPVTGKAMALNFIGEVATKALG